MECVTRPSGIPLIGNIPWGSHLCQFYRSRSEQLGLLVPWFKAGLENGEGCVWMVAGSLTCAEAEGALRAEVPDLDERIASGQMAFADTELWYRENGKFSVDHVLRFWTDKVTETMARGYEGLRVSGDSSWVRRDEWSDMQAYEARSDAIVSAAKVLVLCTYPIEKFDACQTLEAMNNHAFSLVRRDGAWHVVENPCRPAAAGGCGHPALPLPGR